MPAADVITPNQFELGFLTDTDALSGSSPSATSWPQPTRLRAMGPSTVLVT